MEKYTVIEVVKAYQVMRDLRALSGYGPPEEGDDPLYPEWVKDVEAVIGQLHELYTEMVKQAKEHNSGER